MRQIILLSGPIGSGKTTVAQHLITSFTFVTHLDCGPSQPTAYLEGDQFWSFFVQPATDDSAGADRFRTIMKSMTLAARAFANDGYEAIVDFSIPPGFLEYARRAAKEIPLHYVVLLPSEAVCAARAAARPVGTTPDYTRYRRLYGLFDPTSRHSICDESLEPAAMAERIRRGLKAGKFLVGI